jgi:hypothetical protein
MMALSSCYGELSEVRVYKVSLGSLSPWLVPLIIMKAETWEILPLYRGGHFGHFLTFSVLVAHSLQWMDTL